MKSIDNGNKEIKKDGRIWDKMTCEHLKRHGRDWSCAIEKSKRVHYLPSIVCMDCDICWNCGHKLQEQGLRR